MNFQSWQVYLALVIVSMAYNQAVGFVNAKTEGDHPLASWEVAVGTIYTVVAAWAIDGEDINILTLGLCFVASGSPMIIGDAMRWLSRR